MTHYFYSPSLKSVFLKLKGNQVYLFNRDTTVSIFIRVLGRIPFIKTWLNNLAQEPDIHIGDYKGLYYKLNKEALECIEFIYDKLSLENCQFIKIYNERFKTTKLKPFVLKWVSVYVFNLLSCLYRVHYDKPSQEVFYLHNSLLNYHIYEWWSRKTGAEIATKSLYKKALLKSWAR